MACGLRAPSPWPPPPAPRPASRAAVLVRPSTSRLSSWRPTPQRSRSTSATDRFASRSFSLRAAWSLAPSSRAFRAAFSSARASASAWKSEGHGSTFLLLIKSRWSAPFSRVYDISSASTFWVRSPLRTASPLTLTVRCLGLHRTCTSRFPEQPSGRGTTTATSSPMWLQVYPLAASASARLMAAAWASALNWASAALTAWPSRPDASPPPRIFTSSKKVFTCLRRPSKRAWTPPPRMRPHVSGVLLRRTRVSVAKLTSTSTASESVATPWADLITSMSHSKMRTRRRATAQAQTVASSASDAVAASSGRPFWPKPASVTRGRSECGFTSLSFSSLSFSTVKP
mmetsp:Transcript_46001/g.103904  ORF Transcript_46001/g.103904 Transcript_46001/m.103904 type:complete len:343 (+) Transcript_46001:390-1418(+)